MPELPFLEILAENLASSVSGRRIESIEIRQPALLQQAEPTPESFHGEYLSLPARGGKYLVLETESRRAIVLHLMRAGRIVIAKTGARKGISARIVFDDGSSLCLVEHGKEKRARLWLADELDAVEDLRGLGPDPTREELTRERFAAAAGATVRQVKTFLTDQRAISGIGNGLSDEILWEARVSPLQRTDRLDDAALSRLYDATRSVLDRQVKLLRESAAGDLPQKEPVEHYTVHDHKGDPCPRCKTPIAWISYAEKDTFYCPGCQTGGVPLKDRRMSKLLK
ncbi:MAG: DNA-formamidopyrimidine glycosylase family protein [Candidatus Eiseniibacteriota bacterium]